ncbi:MAG: hypothetical protein KA974_04780 [Saprospiraceae bacterium]|nr:hypothetical protein [Saprospiraceae bacterium]MBP7699580.1 hypothetical protein [Saprospiraceae bacterium]
MQKYLIFIILIFNILSSAFAQQHYFEYNKLLADGKLDIAIAIGYEEENWYLELTRQMRGWIEGQGYGTLHQPICSGQDFYQSKKIITNPLTNETLPVEINITLITPATGSAKLFLSQLQSVEIMLYLGHARGGIGPDFDHKSNPKEQVVFGKNSALHRQGVLQLPQDNYYKTVVTYNENDLEKLLDAWAGNHYRIWLFDACRTNYYVDEFRGGLLPYPLGAEALDLIVTNELTPIDAYFDTARNFLLNLFSGSSIEATLQNINEANNKFLYSMMKKIPKQKSVLQKRLNAIYMDGIEDNPQLMGE